MSVAVSLAWISAGPSPVERRRTRRGKGPRLALVTRPISLYAVSCFVCGTMSPPVANRERGWQPPKSSGFVWQTIGGVSGWMCNGCHSKYRIMLPPATRGDCIDGPRPCRALLCRYNMYFDASRKADKSFRVLQTCALDVADEGEHTLKAIGAILGMTREGVRYQQLIATNKVRTVPGLEIDFDELLEGEDQDDESEGGEDG
jgi:hypothetical protein